MSDKVFIDTNILIYLLGDNQQKKRKALDICKNNALISINVLNEYTNVCRKKFHRPLPSIKQDIELLLVRLVLVFPGLETFYHTLDLGQKTGYSHFDSLMLATALDAECSIFYSEDLQHNQIIEGKLRITNPFTGQ